MLIERYSSWTLFAISLVSALLFYTKQQDASFIILSLTAPVSFGFIWKIRSITRKFSKHFQNTTSLPSAAFTHFEQRIDELQAAEQSIIRAIEKIGNNESLGTLRIEGKAGEAISGLQSKLAIVKEEEHQRVWAAQGIAQISEIRKDNTNLNDYAFKIICHLVKFLQANQGVFYIKNDDDANNPCLELLATYAYGKRKYTSDKVTLEYGTGLVGQCALEGSIILMTDVPSDYVKITSGLGEALPRCLVLTPLIFRGEIFGVIEIASFQKFDQYQLDFIMKACETIGLELNGIRAQERTRKLLEQSREEELHQNLEEMKVTQLQMKIKEEELSHQLRNTQRAMAMADTERKKNEAILDGCMDAVISFNQDGIIEYFNKSAEEMFGVSKEVIIDQDITEILNIHVVENQTGSFRILSVTGNEVTLRTEVNATDSKGEDISLLLTATQVKLDKKHLFTLFAQRISVELF